MPRNFILLSLAIGASQATLGTPTGANETRLVDPCVFLVKEASLEPNLVELLRGLDNPIASTKKLQGHTEALAQQISLSQNAAYWITSLRRSAQEQLPELINLAGEKARVDMKDPRAKFSSEDQSKYEALKSTYSQLHKLAKKAYDLRRARLISDYHERQGRSPPPRAVSREEALKKVDFFLERKLKITESLLRTRHDSRNLGSGGYSDKARDYGLEILAMRDPQKKQRAIAELRAQLATAKEHEKNYDDFFSQDDVSVERLDAMTLELSREWNRSVALEEALTAAEGRYAPLEAFDGLPN